jgi:energy-coupling factor transporter ATP-binding protein EcfA2
MKFSKLTLKSWRQFENVDLDFHPRLTIVTGANGAGKSTVLRLLAQNYGWRGLLLATPTYTNEGTLSYSSGVSDAPHGATPLPSTSVGKFVYSDGQESQIMVPAATSITYNVTLGSQKPIFGLHIGSHRSDPAYKQVGNIPTDVIRVERAYQLYQQEEFNRSNDNYSQYSPLYRMKEAIISMATFGPGNQYVQANKDVAKLFENFKEVLTKMLPPAIGFRDINIRIPDVVIVTSSGDFAIDAASGGLMSLIDMSWQIFLFSHDKKEFVVTIDEIENHLHPSMQRTVLGSLLAAFPAAQFIVATHSPFIVSSVRDSSVYVLRHVPLSRPGDSGGESKISSLKLDRANKAGSANEILRDVLGVPVTLPQWAEDDLRKISDEFEIENLDSANISKLRDRLDEAGLGEYYPEAIQQIAGPR